MYDPVADSWEVISHMLTPRIKCFAAVLPGNRVMVVGGHTNEEVIVIQGRKIGVQNRVCGDSNCGMTTI